MKKVAIGVKTKTGRAIAVALSEQLEFIGREELILCDESTKQPYHDVMELPWNESIVAVKPAIATIERIAAEALRRLIASIESRGLRVECVAVVGPADRKLERIGNPHIRAHAAEGVLFRAVVEKAAKVNRRQTRSFVDPAAELKRSAREVKSALEKLGKIAGAPWRAEEKSAAIAAWAALTARRSS